MVGIDQHGYITPAFSRDPIVEESKWLHNPYLLGDPPQGDKIRSGCTNTSFLGHGKVPPKNEHYEYKDMG